MSKALVSIVLVLAVTACSPGPSYRRPAVPVPATYKELGAEWQPARPRDNIPRGQWWKAFNDSTLDGLEEKLNASNQNIAAAAANVEVARAIVSESQAQFFPTVTAKPAVTRGRTSTPSAPHALSTVYSLPLEASWEPDLWGRVRSGVKAGRLAEEARMADLENVRLSGQAELAADYYALRLQDAQKRLLDATVRAYREELGLARARLKSGAGDDEAVAQAEVQLKTAEGTAANIGILRARYEHAIALLCGQPASMFTLPPRVLKMEPPPVPVGLPSVLLERRPDIAASERAVAAANAEVGVAETAFFPALTLGASAGLQGFSEGQWLALPNLVWSLGPNLAQSIFDAGLRRATVRQFKASYDLSAANYRQTVLTAFQQVEDNLSDLRILDQVIGQQDDAVKAARRNLGEARARYKAGVDPYLNVLAAQTALLANRQAAVNFRMQQMEATVQLVKALGGGWTGG